MLIRLRGGRFLHWKKLHKAKGRKVYPECPQYLILKLIMIEKNCNVVYVSPFDFLDLLSLYSFIFTSNKWKGIRIQVFHGKRTN